MGTCCATVCPCCADISPCCKDAGTGIKHIPGQLTSNNKNQPKDNMKDRPDEDDATTWRPPKDLDPSTSPGPEDEIEQFEQSLPFNRIEITDLIKRANDAAAKQKNATSN